MGPFEKRRLFVSVLEWLKVAQPFLKRHGDATAALHAAVNALLALCGGGGGGVV